MMLQFIADEMPDVEKLRITAYDLFANPYSVYEREELNNTLQRMIAN